ncbi:MAG: fimbrillin family protein [Bacteroidales bacterium]|nr:fimbrillin family protein [Bacteroidales bacterium]
MKKSILFAVAALALLASCTKVDTVVADQAITFNVANYLQQTRADAYNTDDNFGVYAYWTANNWDAEGTANIFMDNEKVGYNPSYAEGSWGTESTYYWPRTGAITFACYSPYTAQGRENGYSEVPSFTKENGFTISNYTIVDQTDVDLMTADVVPDQSRNAGAAATGQVAQNAPVPVLFHHLLTQVAFKFKTVENPNPSVGESEIVVNEVVVKNVANTGNYTQVQATPTQDQPAPVWSRQAGEARYEFNSANSPLTVLPTDNEPKATSVPSRILLPQDLTAVQADITFTIRTKYGDNWAEETLTSTVNLATANVPAWLPNMSIVYIFTIDPVSKDPILFDPAIAPWDTTIEVPITIPEA